MTSMNTSSDVPQTSSRQLQWWCANWRRRSAQRSRRFSLLCRPQTAEARLGLNGADVTAFAVAADGKSVSVAVNSGTLTRLISFPANGAATEQPLFSVTSTVWDLDAGPDGSVYAGMLDRPSDLARPSASSALSIN